MPNCEHEMVGQGRSSPFIQWAMTRQNGKKSSFLKGLDIRAYDPYSEQARRVLHFDYWHHGVLTKKIIFLMRKRYFFGTFLLPRARKVPAIVFKVPNSILKCSQGFKVSKNVWLFQGHACLAGARELWRGPTVPIFRHFLTNLFKFVLNEVIWTWKAHRVTRGQVRSPEVTWDQIIFSFFFSKID